MDFMKLFHQDLNDSTKKLLDITHLQSKQRVKYLRNIKITKVNDNLKSLMSELPSAESILTREDRVKILKLRKTFEAMVIHYEQQNLYIYNNILEETVKKEKYIKSKDEELPQKFSGRKEITLRLAKKPTQKSSEYASEIEKRILIEKIHKLRETTIAMEALNVPCIDEIFETMEDIKFVQLKQHFLESLSTSASTVTIEDIQMGPTNGGLDVTGQILERDWSFSSREESSLDLFNEQDVSVREEILTDRQDEFIPNRFSLNVSPLMFHDDTNEHDKLDQHFETFTHDRTAPNVAVKPPKKIKNVYRDKTKVIILKGRSLSHRYLQSRFPEDKDEDLSFLNIDLPSLDSSFISIEEEESQTFQQNLLVEISDSVRQDDLAMAVPSHLARPSELRPTEVSQIHLETAEPSFHIRAKQSLGRTEELPDLQISRTSEMPSTSILRGDIEESEIRSQDFCLIIKEKIYRIWNEKNSSTVKFTDICSFDRSRLEAAKTFFVLLDLHRNQEISLTQDSPNPEQIYINKK